ARPVMTFSADTVSVSLGAEVPVEDALETNDWVGFGAAATAQASDDVTIHARIALKTGDDAIASGVKGNAMTAGLGAQIQNFYIAALYGNDDYDAGDSVNETQIYASYKIPSVLDIDNFDIYLAAGYAIAEDSDNDVVGGRVRLKYVF
ncbi:MAG: carbohydrate porin, partial [Psychromonas sp.]